MIPVRIQSVVHLLKKQLLEQRRFYLLSLLGLFVCLVILNMAFYYFVDIMDNNKFTAFSALAYNFGFIIVTTIISAASFYELHNPKNSITYLQLPVTFPERIIANIIIAFVIMPLLLFGVIYGVDWLFTTIYNARHLPRYMNPPLEPGMVFVDNFSWVDYTMLTLLLNGIYFAGAAFFKKLNWVLTTVVVGLFITCITCLNVLPAINGIVSLPYILALSNQIIQEGLNGLDGQFTRGGYEILRGFRVFLWYLPLLLTLAVFYRLKEKQV
jgi:hypothetical protein